jgi:hypothetical protein
MIHQDTRQSRHHARKGQMYLVRRVRNTTHGVCNNTAGRFHRRGASLRKSCDECAIFPESHQPRKRAAKMSNEPISTHMTCPPPELHHMEAVHYVRALKTIRVIIIVLSLGEPLIMWRLFSRLRKACLLANILALL